VTLIAAITLGIALTGAVLGIINTAHALRRDRVRVRVRPTLVLARGFEGLAVDVINQGLIPITVAEVGFTIGRGRHPCKIVLARFERSLGEALPCRLEPRCCATIVDGGDVTTNPEFPRVTSAYARTACGLVFRGRSGALRQAVKESRTRSG
jgi:hypothetical protein